MMTEFEINSKHKGQIIFHLKDAVYIKIFQKTTAFDSESCQKCHEWHEVFKVMMDSNGIQSTIRALRSTLSVIDYKEL